MSSQIEYNGMLISIPPKPLTPPKNLAFPPKPLTPPKMSTVQSETIPKETSKVIPRTLIGDIYETFKAVPPKFSRVVTVLKPKVTYAAQTAKIAMRKTTAVSIAMVNIAVFMASRIRTPKWVTSLFSGSYLTRFASGHSPRVSGRILQWSGIASLFIPLLGLAIAPLALIYSKHVKFRNNKIDYYTYLNMLSLSLYGTLLAVAFAVFMFVQVVVIPIINALP